MYFSVFFIHKFKTENTRSIKQHYCEYFIYAREQYILIQSNETWNDSEFVVQIVLQIACDSIAGDPAFRAITCLEDGSWDHRFFQFLPDNIDFYILYFFNLNKN